MSERRLLTPIELMKDERKRTIKDVIEMLVNKHGYSPNSVIIKDIEQLKENK